MYRRLFFSSFTAIGAFLWAARTILSSHRPLGGRRRLRAAPFVPVGTAFLYTGQLSSNFPANGTYNFIFNLYDATAGGTKLGSNVQLNGVTVTGSFYSVWLDFGAGIFQGDTRYLEIEVQPAGNPNWTMLSPRQPVPVAPYAIGLVPGAAVLGSSLGGVLFTVQNTGGTAATFRSKGSDSEHRSGYHGIEGWGDAGSGVYGRSNIGPGVEGVSDLQNGVHGLTAGSGVGVLGESPSNGIGVRGVANVGDGVAASSSGGDGVHAEAAAANRSGVYGGNTGDGFGVWGYSVRGEGMHAESQAGNGLHAVAFAPASSAIYAENISSGAALVATCADPGRAIQGVGFGRGTGVYGFNSDPSGFAAFFQGNVYISGTLRKGSNQFMIDHPLDPGKKYLKHCGIESSEMKNLYDGTVMLDSHGEATIQLPKWVGELNKDFRYQLTCVGGYAPVYISGELKGNSFRIAGGKPELQVCWQLTGTRDDPWARHNPMSVEEDKLPEDLGYYLHPELYGEAESKGIGRVDISPIKPREEDHIRRTMVARSESGS